jgi:hypothetical protein
MATRVTVYQAIWPQGVVAMHPTHYGLMVATGGKTDLSRIFTLADLVEGHEPFSGTGMGCTHSLITKVLRLLMPLGYINF